MTSLGFQSKSVLDSRLNNKVGSRKEWETGLTASQINYKRIKSSSGDSNTSIVWQIFPSNSTSVIDRSIILETKCRINFTGTASPGENLLQRSCDAPRGLGSVIGNLEVRVNGLGFNIIMTQLLDIFKHYHNASELNNWSTVCPTLQYNDNCQNYHDVFGSTMNPLASYLDSTPSKIGRGAYPYTIISNTPTSAEVEVVLYEFLYMMPYTTNNNDDSAGLTRVKTMDVTVNFESSLSRVWSHSSVNGSVITGSSVNFSESHIHYLELTPPEPIIQVIPPVVSYNYSEYKSSVTNNITTLNSLDSTIVSTNNYQLSVVPSYVFLYAKESQASINSSIQSQLETPDCFAAINLLNVENYNNTPTQLSGATALELYKISNAAGLKGTYQEFLGETFIPNAVGETQRLPLTGSIVCIDFSKDISQNNITLVPGTSINSNLQFKIGIKNTSNRSIIYDLHTVYVYDSIMSIDENNATKFIALNSQDQSSKNPIVDEPEMQGQGKGWDKFKHGLKKAVTPALDVAASALGYMYPGTAPLVQTGRKAIKDVTGYGLQGGQAVSRKSLKDRY